MAYMGDIEVVKDLLDSGRVDPMVRDNEKSTPVQQAVIYGQFLALGFLLERNPMDPRPICIDPSSLLSLSLSKKTRVEERSMNILLFTYSDIGSSLLLDNGEACRLASLAFRAFFRREVHNGKDPNRNRRLWWSALVYWVMRRYVKEDGAEVIQKAVRNQGKGVW